MTSNFSKKKSPEFVVEKNSALKKKYKSFIKKKNFKEEKY